MADSRCSLSSSVVMWRASRRSIFTEAMSAPRSFASENKKTKMDEKDEKDHPQSTK